MASEKGKLAHTAGYYISWAVIAAGVFLLVKAPGICRESVIEGMSMCARAVIPSVFPMSIAGYLMSRLSPPSFMAKPLSKIFGLPPEASGAVITGLLAGFPTGALMTADLKKRGMIDAHDAGNMICYISSPAPVFIVSVVGAYSLGSRRAGALLAVVSLSVSVVTGVILGRKRARVFPRSVNAVRPLCVRDVTEAVRNSALAVINVTAFVTAFSMICGYISSTAGDGASAVLKGVLEIGNGAGALAISNLPRNVSIAAAGALVGWTGVSAQMQVISVCTECGISVKKYCLLRPVTAAVTAGLCMLISVLPLSAV